MTTSADWAWRELRESQERKGAKEIGSFDAADALELSGTTVDTALIPLLERIKDVAERRERTYSSWFSTRNRPEVRGVYREVFNELRARGFRVTKTLWGLANTDGEVHFEVKW